MEPFRDQLDRPPPKATAATCQSCRWWFRYEDHGRIAPVFDGQSECRRRAPVLVPDSPYRFPLMELTGYCGEYEEGQR